MGGAIHDQALAGLPQYVQNGLRSLAKRTKALWALPLLHLLLAVLIYFYGGQVAASGGFGAGSQSMSLVGQILRSFFPWLYMGGIFWPMAILYAGMIIYGMWIYRANSNLDFMAVRRVKNSPVDAVFWPLVPLAQLWMPYLAAREIWRGSDPSYPEGFEAPEARSSPAQRWWYITLYFLWLATFMLVGFVAVSNTQHHRMTYDALSVVKWAPLVGLIVVIVLGIINYWCLLTACKKILVRQMERAKRIWREAPVWLSIESIRSNRLKRGLDIILRRKKQLTIWGLIALAVMILQIAVALISSGEGVYLGKSGLNYWAQPAHMKVMLISAPVPWLMYIFPLPQTLFLMWCFCAYRNLDSLRVAGTKHTPARAFLWWFIPLFNVVGMAWILNEIWRASDPNLEKDGDISGRKGSALVVTFVILLALHMVLFTALIIVIHCMYPQSTTQAWIVPAGKIYGVVSGVLWVLQTACLMALAAKITNRQMARTIKVHGKALLPDEAFAKIQRRKIITAGPPNDRPVKDA